jgi:predicted DNA-binding ribbon-helix-helix protein
MSQSSLKLKNVIVDDHRTSIRLEPEMWEALKEICARERVDAATLCSRIKATKQIGGFTSAVRVYILTYFRSQCASPQSAKLNQRRQVSRQREARVA